HSYPHDWRSKTPTIFRCTNQWFVGVDRPQKNLRQMSLDATREGGPVAFVPEWGRNRMRGMLEARPDWCISRQRAWGVSIPSFFFTDANGRETVFMTAASVKAVARVVREKGADAWFTDSPAELLKYYDAASDTDPQAKGVPANLSSLKKGYDILDVW